MATLPAALEIVFDAHEYPLFPDEEQLLRDKLDGLARQVERFPIAELRCYIQGVRSREAVVKLSLILPGTTLSVDDHDLMVVTAFERCLDSLVQQLDAYKDRLNRTPDVAKVQEGTYHELHPTFPVSVKAIDAAVNEGDYAAFHAAMMPFDEELRRRIGRWVQRYPALNEMIGSGLEIADIHEEVLLLAFEGYANRPLNVPLGTWVESLIDPAIKELGQHPDAVMENIAAVRSARGAVEGQRPALS